MKSFFISIASFLLMACSSKTIFHPHNPNGKPHNSAEKKEIVVFLDGTNNTEKSRTNVYNLFKMITLQNREDITAIYIPGVGSDPTSIIGMATGWGIGNDVIEAYEFISQNYSENSNIYLFGFSRGAYAARILSGLIYTAGIPKNYENKNFSKIFKSYKSPVFIWKDTINNRRKRIEYFLKPEQSYTDVRIKFMGLWDTVESLGLRGAAQIQGNNEKYIDQLCNIEKAAHALSLDDNRGGHFTPRILYSKNLIELCPEYEIQNNVSEVWFSGAHSNVGGGYDSNHLSGISMNWMLGEIKQYNLLPEEASVYEKIDDLSKDAESNFKAYQKKNRNISSILFHSIYPEKKLPIHDSAIKRLTNPGKAVHDYDWNNSKYPEKGETIIDFSVCFDITYKNKEKNKKDTCAFKECLFHLKNKDCFNIIYNK